MAVGSQETTKVSGVTVLGVKRPEVYLVRQLVFHLRVLSLLARKWSDIDIVLHHQMSAPWLLPLRFFRSLVGRERPLLVMDTRTLPMTPMESSTVKDRLRGLFTAEMNRLANAWADGQTTITERMAEAVQVPREKHLGSWPSGVREDDFKAAIAVRDWQSVAASVRMVYIGALHRERNLLALGHAVEAANANGMNFSLLLVGDGTARPELEALANATAGLIRIADPVPHEVVWKALAQAHVGVLPLPNEEKFRVSSPIKLFEYAASGLPILATRIASHTDVLGDANFVFWAEDATENGLLSAMHLIWHERLKLSELGHEASALAMRWTWRASAKKLSRSLERVLGRVEEEEILVAPES